MNYQQEQFENTDFITIIIFEVISMLFITHLFFVNISGEKLHSSQNTNIGAISTLYQCNLQHFLSTDYLHIDASPYVYCDLDPINKIDVNGNAPTMILPKEFEMEMGRLPRFYGHGNVSYLNYWENLSIQVKNRQVLYATQIQNEKTFLTRRQFHNKIYASKKTIDRLPVHLQNPLHNQEWLKLHTRSQFVKSLSFDPTGKVIVSGKNVEFIKKDNEFYEAMQKLSSNGTAVTTSSQMTSNSTTLSSASTITSSSTVTNVQNANPIPSTSGQYTHAANSDVMDMQIAQGRTMAQQRSNDNTLSATAARSSTPESPLGDVGFRTFPSWSTLPPEEPEFYSFPTLEDVLKHPAP